MISKILTIAALFGVISAKELYEPNHSDVTMYTKLNFDKQVMQKRDKGISIVHFFRANGK